MGRICNVGLVFYFMKKLCFILLVLCCIVDISAKDIDLFTSLVKQKKYSMSLEQIDYASDCLRPLVFQDISFQDYEALINYAYSVEHQFRDSLFINGINYLTSFGLKASQNGNYDIAISLYELSLSYISIIPIIDVNVVSGIHNQLGICYGKIAKYDKAIEHASSCYEIHKMSSDTIWITASLNNLGLYNFYANNYLEAKKCLDKAYGYSLSLPLNHSERIRTLSNYTLVLQSMGFYEKALINLQECLVALEKDDSIYVPVILNNLSAVCASLGKYDLVIEYSEKALSLLSSQSNLSKNEVNNRKSLILNNLSLAYYYLNNPNKAIEYLEKSLEIYRPINNDEYAILLSNLGMFYSEIDLNKSLDYYNTAIDLISEKNFNYPRLLNSVSMLLYENDRYEDAKYYCELALESVRSLGTYTDPTIIATLYTTLSVIYGDLGKNGKSLEFSELAVKLAERRGVNSDLYALFKSNLAFKYSFIKGKEIYAYDQWSKVLQIYTELVKKNFDYLTEKEREQYWQKTISLHRFIPSFVHKNYTKYPSFSTLAYNDALLTKGVLLQSSNFVRNSIKNSDDAHLKEKWDELVELHQLLSSPILNIETKDSLFKTASQIEHIIMNDSREFRESSEIWNIDWNKIQDNICDNDVVIEFVDFYTMPQKQKTEHMYASLLINKECEYPIYIPLFTEDEILEILGDLNDIYSLNSNKLFALIWSKIIPYIIDSKNVYFAPTGILHQLAIEYLPVDSARTMSDVYNMVRLSSTREIVTNKSNESYKSAVTYGGIHYDLDNKTILTESNRYPDVKRSSLENDSINRGSAKFLPGTKEEAEKINKLLTDNKIEAIIYKTKSANEESFKSLSGKHNNILHIATHGFTWTDSTARKQDYFADRMKMQLIGDNQMRGPVIDPLDRCGLLFAGANTALQGKSKELPEGVQDGILTAKEISLMDLRDAELVVLSACETAKGDITSEGVFGLQRAFKMAGAKTIIMSLWKVDDNATQLLMTEFYTNWISKKQSKREAFRNAQNTVRYAKDSEGDYMYNNPIYWAGFIMLD